MSKRIAAVCAVLALLTIPCQAQESDGVRTQNDKSTGIRIGAELDPLPYALGGYFGAVTIGGDHFRLRVLGAGGATKPDFIVPEGFTKNTLDAYAAVVDIFPFTSDYSSWWGYAGIVRWNSTIQNSSDHAVSAFSNTLLSIGGGYSYFFYKHFYVSPWAGIHTRIGGETDVVVGNKTYHVPLFSPEASVKVGWYVAM